MGTCNHLGRVITFFSTAFGAAVCAQAQTFSDLQAAVSSAADGDTVYVTNDMTFDAAVTVASGKSITIEGWDTEGGTGRVWKLTRDLGYAAGAFFTASDGARQLTLKNVVLDLQCNKRQRQLTGRVIEVTTSASRFTLGAGAKICNVYQDGDHPGTMYAGGAGTVVMEEGSEISDAYCYAYGAAVQAGRNSLGIFIMNGGLITDCHGPDSRGDTDDWGGAVYVYGGQFKFNGGTITGNSSPYHTGGVVLTRGNGTDSTRGMMFCGGSGAITGNVGQVANDVYCKENDSNIWIVNATYTDNTTYYKGAVLTVKCGNTVPVAGDVSSGLTLQASSSAAAFVRSELGNVSLQDDPSLALDPDGINSTGDKYRTPWRRKLADIVVDGACRARFTLSDVWSAINGKAAVVSFWQDVEMDTNVNGPKDFYNLTDIVLRSAGDVRRRFSVPATNRRGLFFLHQPANYKRVRFENIIVDGNSANGAISPGGLEGFIWLQRNCELQLGPGATFCNVYCPSNRAGIVAVSKSRLVIEEGAVVSNIVAGSWCSAILVGADNATSDPTTFDMSGGLITACSASTGGNPKDGNGGPVTLRRAQMNMSGGAITGNRAPGNASAGVLLHKTYPCELNLSGDARICDNIGNYPDVFVGQDCVHFSGDFRGLVGVCDTSLSLNVNPDAGATGAWCFYKASGTAANHKKYWGYVDGGTFAWGTPTGWIDGYGFVQASDVDVRLADEEDLSTPEARANLPHVLSGSALAGTLTQTFTFDAKTMAESDVLPLRLYAFQDGDFTGTVNVTLPDEGKYHFSVRKHTEGGVRGLYLMRDTLGMVILFR